MSDVLEFIDWDTLEALVNTGAIELRTGLRVLRQVAEAVNVVHERGFAHRNLHPSNVLVDEAGRAHLIGFGRVGLLKEVTAEDVSALCGLVRWLAETLDQPLPNALRFLGTITTPAALAAALAAHV